MTGQIPLFNMTIVGPLPWGSSGHDKSKNPVNGYEEMRRLTLWLDCSSMFYGVYEKDGGEAQLRGEIAFTTLE